MSDLDQPNKNGAKTDGGEDLTEEIFFFEGEQRSRALTAMIKLSGLLQSSVETEKGETSLLAFLIEENFDYEASPKSFYSAIGKGITEAITRFNQEFPELNEDLRSMFISSEGGVFDLFSIRLGAVNFLNQSLEGNFEVDTAKMIKSVGLDSKIEDINQHGINPWETVVASLLKSTYEAAQIIANRLIATKYKDAHLIRKEDLKDALEAMMYMNGAQNINDLYSLSEYDFKTHQWLSTYIREFLGEQ